VSTETTHPIWDSLLGQPEAIEQLQVAVREKGERLPHSWLFTGPAGSGRSNLAFAFAAALQCEKNGCGSCPQCRLAIAGAHPDITVLATERVIISIEEVRDLVSRSQLSSSMGKFRVLIIEDADRMTERTSNVLLKALEEPPANTVWVLCAPSVADMLPTIRSRVRNLNLRLPSATEVARLLTEREGVDPALALRCATEAQCHVGMARRLALSSDARARRAETLQIALGISSLSRAMIAAEKFAGVAKRDAEAVSEERDESEAAALRAALGVSEGDRLPPAVRAQFKDLEENQKRRRTRALRDGVDRIFTDLESVYRDLLAIQLGGSGELINSSIESELRERAAASTPVQNLAVLDEIGVARKRLAGNVRDLLILEALATHLIVRPDAAA
jgi:DNA polymerase-3 subunit delta'